MGTSFLCYLRRFRFVRTVRRDSYDYLKEAARRRRATSPHATARSVANSRRYYGVRHLLNDSRRVSPFRRAASARCKAPESCCWQRRRNGSSLSAGFDTAAPERVLQKVVVSSHCLSGRESNPCSRIRSPMLYPLSYLYAQNGIRTRDLSTSLRSTIELPVQCGHRPFVRTRTRNAVTTTCGAPPARIGYRQKQKAPSVSRPKGL